MGHEISPGKSWLICAPVLAITALALLVFSDRAPDDPALRPSQQVRPERPLTIKLPDYAPSPQALARMLASDRLSWRRGAIQQLRKRPSEESLLLLLDHIGREKDHDLACRTILAAKRMSREMGSGLASRKLVTLFEKTPNKRQLRFTVIAAFELYPFTGDDRFYQRMRDVAVPGEETEKIEALLRRKSS